MFCPTCGKEVTEGSRFCLSCGTAISNDSMAAPTQPETSGYTAPQQNTYQAQPNSYTMPNQPNAYQAPYQQSAYTSPEQPGAYQAPMQPSYQMDGHYKPTYGQPGTGYSYNSDSRLFLNPHTGLLAFIVILGFLTAIMANCGLIKFSEEAVRYMDNDLKYFAFIPMWLIAGALVYQINDGGTDELFYSYRYTDIDIVAIYKGIMIAFIVLAVLALFSFIFSCIIAGKSSLRRRHPSKQLKTMNTFLILNWLFWLIYAVIILLPMVMVYKETSKVYFLIQPTIYGYIYTGSLLLMTILKSVYSKKVMRAYTAYERGQNGYHM